MLLSMDVFVLGLTYLVKQTQSSQISTFYISNKLINFSFMHLFVTYSCESFWFVIYLCFKSCYNYKSHLDTLIKTRLQTKSKL